MSKNKDLIKSIQSSQLEVESNSVSQKENKDKNLPFTAERNRVVISYLSDTINWSVWQNRSEVLTKDELEYVEDVKLKYIEQLNIPKKFNSLQQKLIYLPVPVLKELIESTKDDKELFVILLSERRYLNDIVSNENINQVQYWQELLSYHSSIINSLDKGMDKASYEILDNKFENIFMYFSQKKNEIYKQYCLKNYKPYRNFKLLGIDELINHLSIESISECIELITDDNEYFVKEFVNKMPLDSNLNPLDQLKKIVQAYDCFDGFESLKLLKKQTIIIELTQMINSYNDTNLEHVLEFSRMFNKELTLSSYSSFINFRKNVVKTISKYLTAEEFINGINEFRENELYHGIDLSSILSIFDFDYIKIKEGDRLDINNIEGVSKTKRFEECFVDHNLIDLLNYSAASNSEYKSSRKWIKLLCDSRETASKVVDEYKPFINIGLTQQFVKENNKNDIDTTKKIPFCFKTDESRLNYIRYMQNHSEFTSDNFTNTTLEILKSFEIDINSSKELIDNYCQIFLELLAVYHCDPKLLNFDFMFADMGLDDDKKKLFQLYFNEILNFDDLSDVHIIARYLISDSGSQTFPELNKKIIEHCSNVDTKVNLFFSIPIRNYLIKLGGLIPLDVLYTMAYKSLYMGEDYNIIMKSGRRKELDDEKLKKILIGTKNKKLLDYLEVEYNIKGVELAESYFGDNVRYDIYKIFEIILEDPKNPVLLDYGIDLSNTKFDLLSVDEQLAIVITKFEEYLKSLKAQFAQSDFDIDSINNNVVCSKMFELYTKFSVPFNETFDEDELKARLIEDEDEKYLKLFGITYSEKAMELVIKFFGPEYTFELYKVFETILEEPESPKLQEYGIILGSNIKTKENKEIISKEALRQFQLYIKKIKESFVQQDFKLSSIQDNPIALEILKIYVRFIDSDWSSGDNDRFDKIVENQIAQEHNLPPLEECYEPSEIITISSYTESSESNDLKLSQEFKTYLKKVFTVYNKAYSEFQTTGPENKLKHKVNSLKERIRSKLEEKISELNRLLLNPEENYKTNLKIQYDLIKDKIETANEPEKSRLVHKLSQISKQYDKVDSNFITPNTQKLLKLTNALSLLDDNSNYRTLINNLYKESEFRDELLEFLFMLTFIRHPEQTSKLAKIMNKDNFLYEDITSLESFFSNLASEETWFKDVLFKNPSTEKDKLQNILLKNNYKGIVQIDYLSENIKAIKTKLGLSTKKIKFIPTNGPLLQFSGELADACWADKDDSIISDYPNMVAVTIVEDYDQSSQRAMGSCLLIESEDKDGKILIIRGLNPRNELINKVEINEFFNQFLIYTEEIATKMNARLAIAMSNQSGGCTTNRPGLFDVISKHRLGRNVKPLEIDEKPTTFNGYDLEKKVYLISPNDNHKT